jgi:hypothetical protein
MAFQKLCIEFSQYMLVPFISMLFISVARLFALWCLNCLLCVKAAWSMYYLKFKIEVVDILSFNQSLSLGMMHTGCVKLAAVV